MNKESQHRITTGRVLGLLSAIILLASMPGGAPTLVTAQADVGVPQGSGPVAAAIASPSGAWTTSPAWGASYGYSFSAGDVNGDGYTDVLTQILSSSGDIVRVYYGDDWGLDARPGWEMQYNPNPHFPSPVVGGLDVNGDGYDDVVVGLPEYDTDKADVGRVLVYLGSAKGLATTPVWTGVPTQAGIFFGKAVASVGDVNGDGCDDVGIGTATEMKIYYGSAQGLAPTAAWSKGSAWFGPAGDVNRDGFDDVVIITSNSVLVHYGSAAGLGTSAAWSVSGSAVGTASAAGDVNGDGYDDLLVGAPGFGTTEPAMGRVSLYLGSATGLARNAVWTITGDHKGEYLGIHVSSAGDLNHDGYDDVMVNDVIENLSPEHSRCRLLIYHGGPAGLPTTPTWSITYETFSIAMSAAGDVNGDGYADIMVGIPGYSVLVYHGASTGIGAGAAWTLESNSLEAQFGSSVTSAGDVNGDGYADLIVGAPFFDDDQREEGQASVYFGSDTVQPATPGWTVEGELEGANLGREVASAGDVNGDGYADVIVLANSPRFVQARLFLGSAAGPAATPAWTLAPDGVGFRLLGAVAAAGDVNGDGYSDVMFGIGELIGSKTSVYVYYGSPGGLQTSPSWTVQGDQAGSNFGFALASAGDVNGDGYDDVIIGAPGYDNGQRDEGRAYVYHGSAAGLAAAPAWTAEIDLADANFGAAVAGAGDVNGDGFHDVIVGLPQASYSSALYRGGVAVYYGTRAGLSSRYAWAVGGFAWENVGRVVASAGDTNGDGYADVIFSGPDCRGWAYLARGSETGLKYPLALTVTSDSWNPSLYCGGRGGFAGPTASAGDVNGDGSADWVVGSPLETHGGYLELEEGRVYLYYGTGSAGMLARLQQRRADDSAPIAPGGSAASADSVRLAGLARGPAGQRDVKLQWEIKERGAAFDGSGLGESAWQDGGIQGFSFDELVTGLDVDKRYHLRVRVLARPHGQTGAAPSLSRWVYGGTFFTALTGQQPISGTGQTQLLGQAAYVNVKQQGTPPLTSLSITGHPDTRHPQASPSAGLPDGTRALSRYFAIVPNAGAAGYELDLCLNYDDAEVAQTVTAEDRLALCRWDGAAWHCYARGAGSDATANLVCADDVTALSDWIVTEPAAPSSTPTPTVTPSATLTPTPSATPDVGQSRTYLPLLQQGDEG